MYVCKQESSINVIERDGTDPGLAHSWRHTIEGKVDGIIGVDLCNELPVAPEPSLVGSKQVLNWVVDWTVGGQEDDMDTDLGHQGPKAIFVVDCTVVHHEDRSVFREGIHAGQLHDGRQGGRRHNVTIGSDEHPRGYKP